MSASNLLTGQTEGVVEVMAGRFHLGGESIQLDFQVKKGASTAEKDAAFMAALAQVAFVEYLPIGEASSQELTGENKEVVLCSGYAGSILGGNAPAYRALELRGVRNFSDDQEQSCIEPCDEDPQFFSVYACLKEGGVDCVGDFETYALALAYAEALAAKFGWPLHDYQKPAAGPLSVRMARVLAEMLEREGHSVSGVTDHRVAEHGESALVCLARELIAEATKG